MGIFLKILIYFVRGGTFERGAGYSGAKHAILVYIQLQIDTFLIIVFCYFIIFRLLLIRAQEIRAANSTYKICSHLVNTNFM
jgi:hypothetical protein